MEPIRPCAPSARRRRLMLEIGCGTGSAGLAFLLDNEDDPSAVVVFVDIYPPSVAFRVLNTYGLRPFRERIFYHRVAANTWLTVPDIERLSKLAWAADLSDIEKAHYSPKLQDAYPCMPLHRFYRSTRESPPAARALLSVGPLGVGV